MFEDEIESFILPSIHNEGRMPATPETKDAKAQASKEVPRDQPSEMNLVNYSVCFAATEELVILCSILSLNLNQS